MSQQHRQEKIRQAQGLVQSFEALVVAHFPPEHPLRTTAFQQLNQLWATLFLGYHTTLTEAPAPKQDASTESKEEPSEESSAEGQPRLEAVK